MSLELELMKKKSSILTRGELMHSSYLNLQFRVILKLSVEAHPSLLYANLFSSPHALPHPLTPTITLLQLEPVVILLLVVFLLTCLFFQFFSLTIPSLFR